MLPIYPLVAPSAQVSQPASASDLGPYVDEAAQKTGLPSALILVVAHIESNDNPRAVSAKGALGLLQLMPSTWVRLRQQLNLGADPFDPHDNLLAGSVYLRALYDRYGPSGFLAAYNAGPGRYESYRDSGQPLPIETVSYVRRVAENLGADGTTVANLKISSVQPSWTSAALFVASGPDVKSSALPFAVSASPFVSVTSRDSPQAQ